MAQVKQAAAIEKDAELAAIRQSCDELRESELASIRRACLLPRHPAHVWA